MNNRHESTWSNLINHFETIGELFGNFSFVMCPPEHSIALNLNRRAKIWENLAALDLLHKDPIFLQRQTTNQAQNLYSHELNLPPLPRVLVSVWDWSRYHERLYF